MPAACGQCTGSCSGWPGQTGHARLGTVHRPHTTTLLGGVLFMFIVYRRSRISAGSKANHSGTVGRTCSHLGHIRPQGISGRPPGIIWFRRRAPGLVLSRVLPEHRIRNIRDDRAYLGYPESEHVAHGHICAPRARQCCIWNIPTGSHVCRPLVPLPHVCLAAGAHMIPFPHDCPSVIPTPHVMRSHVRVAGASPRHSCASRITAIHIRARRISAMRAIALQSDAERMFGSQMFVSDDQIFKTRCTCHVSGVSGTPGVAS